VQLAVNGIIVANRWCADPPVQPWWPRVVSVLFLFVAGFILMCVVAYKPLLRPRLATQPPIPLGARRQFNHDGVRPVRVWLYRRPVRPILRNPSPWWWHYKHGHQLQPMWSGVYAAGEVGIVSQSPFNADGRLPVMQLNQHCPDLHTNQKVGLCLMPWLQAPISLSELLFELL